MDQTLLLGTGDSLVGRVEIRHEDAFEILQQFLNDFSLAALSEDIDHLAEVRQNPHVRQVTFDIGPGLVGVNEIPLDDPVQNLPFRDRIIIGCSELEVVQGTPDQVEAEHPVQAMLHRELRDA